MSNYGPKHMYNRDHTIPAVKSFPLMLFHSKHQLAKKVIPPVTIEILNTSLTAELYACRTRGSKSGETIVRSPVAPAPIIVWGFKLGTVVDNRFTNPFERMEFEIARNRAPLKLSVGEGDGHTIMYLQT